MQNRYVGDIGEYLKLSILRALSHGYQLGVAWWLYPDGHNNDGRHIGYLQRPEQWRHFDPALFDALAQIVAADRRDVRAIEDASNLVGRYIRSGSDLMQRPHHPTSGSTPGIVCQDRPEALWRRSRVR